MKIHWLAQGGLLFETNMGTTVMVDPYLSNYMFEKRGEMFKRLIPADESFIDHHVDVLVITHCHMDHMDMGTLPELLNNNPELLILSPRSVWTELRPLIKSNQNSVLLDQGCEYTEKDIRFRSICTKHSDQYAIGVQLFTNGWNIYVTGDTLFSRSIINELMQESEKVDIVFTCINGKGNNMNPQDAARLVNQISPTIVVPIHWDMFASYAGDPDRFIEFINSKSVHAYVMREFIPYVLLRLENTASLRQMETEQDF